jgi:hypothetical protein
MESIFTVAALCYLGWGIGMICYILINLKSDGSRTVALLLHLVQVVPILLSAGSCLAIGGMALTGADTIYGVDAIQLLTLNAASQLFVWWSFVAYAIYCKIVGVVS